MSKIRIEIDTGGAAFGKYPGTEIGRILDDLAKGFAEHPYDGKKKHSRWLFDIHGKQVGKLEVIEG